MEFKILNNFAFSKQEEEAASPSDFTPPSLTSTIAEQVDIVFVQKESAFTINDKVYYLNPAEIGDGKIVSLGTFNFQSGRKLLQEMQKKFSTNTGVYNLVVATESSIYFYSSEGADDEVEVKVKQDLGQEQAGNFEASITQTEKYRIEYKFKNSDKQVQEQLIIMNRNIGEEFPAVRGLVIPDRRQTPPSIRRVNFSIKNNSIEELSTTDLFGRESEENINQNRVVEEEKSTYPVSIETHRIVDNA